jgi:hypothetical protein
VSLKAAAKLLLTIPLTLCAYACASNLAAPVEVSLNESSRRLEGWLSTKGEWTVYATQRFSTYSPYEKAEGQKCVSVVNGTGAARSQFNSLDGAKVVVTGFAVKYDTLEGGDDVADHLLSKKYYHGEVVENFCLRDWVFVATSISSSAPHQ